MLAFFIKIETSHGFVIVLKAEKSLKRFSQFYAIYFSCVVYPVPEFCYFNLFNYKVDSGLNNNMETYLKVK